MSIITLHVQRKQGKAICVGVHICIYVCGSPDKTLPDNIMLIKIHVLENIYYNPVYHLACGIYIFS